MLTPPGGLATIYPLRHIAAAGMVLDPLLEVAGYLREDFMKKLFIGVAALPFLANITMASQSMTLADSQMDQVTAGELDLNGGPGALFHWGDYYQTGGFYPTYYSGPTLTFPSPGSNCAAGLACYHAAPGGTIPAVGLPPSTPGGGTGPAPGFGPGGAGVGPGPGNAPVRSF